MTQQELVEKARKKTARMKKQRLDSRYVKTLGKLRSEGLLDVRDIPEFSGQVFLVDALWAAKREPRIYELLPAILTRRPKVFTYLDVPPDLALVVRELRAGHAKTHYQGIAPGKYEKWMNLVGRRRGRPKVMRSFRLDLAEVEILERLAKKRGISQAEIIQQALSALVR